LSPGRENIQPLNMTAFEARSTELNRKLCIISAVLHNKKLSCRRATARHIVSLNILLCHSRSLKIIRN